MSVDTLAYLAPHFALKVVQMVKTNTPSYDVFTEDGKTRVANGVLRRGLRSKEFQVKDPEGNILFKILYNNLANITLKLVIADGTEIAKASIKTITKVYLELVDPETKEIILKGAGDWNKLKMELTGPHGGQMSEVIPAKGAGGHSYILKTVREGINPIFGLATCMLLDMHFHDLLTKE